MATLKEKLREKIEAHRPRTTRLLKEYGDVKVGEVTISQTINGMRGVKGLTTDISYLDPYEGIRFRGRTIPEVMEVIPKPEGKDYPYVEAFWYYLLTGDVPTLEETKEIVEEFKQRRTVPQYVFDILRAMPRDTHPMTMFSAAVLSMQRESKFAKFYAEGFNKMTAWEPMYEDATDIIARLPIIAAYIYRMKYKGDVHIPADPDLDLGGNFAHMMGLPEPYDDVARMYFIIHSDHESGNVSAHATHLVASALSDAYYSLSAGLDGLAGPLHGLANQEVLKWIQGVMKKMDGKLPSEEEMKKFVWDTLNSGQVIPGYGHAVLRKTDPRYMAQREFALKHLPDDPIFKFVSRLYDVVPDILREHGKAKNPWPNVDAHSGVIQWHYGLREYDFYTVLFGVGRAMGVLANITWDRGLGYAIERPKSLTTDMLEEIAGIKK
ncbi:citrate (Si)-synthase [Candidatus Sulfidibacterium hydrothermale]|uniref:citrate (Si)-synthase n=1 Tax=Candidatus Sulfidibacterium hydrothermale TaxID=2875962 RepID=UPI001F0A635F|nr:citrate (Si)-synthase [Candidatus Sulfidibacterium hydrothermale]UBM63044.1 citrate (Si)-synthase [Candidatus Sulfidibacterium hydrothermale]